MDGLIHLLILASSTGTGLWLATIQSTQLTTANTMRLPQLVCGGPWAACHCTVGLDRQHSSRVMTSASWCIILKEASLRRFGSPPSHEPSVIPGRSIITAQSQHLPVWSPQPQVISSSHSLDAACPFSCPTNPPLTNLSRPLFSPTALIAGDSVIRNTNFLHSSHLLFPCSHSPGYPVFTPVLHKPSGCSRVVK